MPALVLRTNADATPLHAVLRHRELLQVQQLTRRSNALFETGHGFCAFLALLLQKRRNDLASTAGNTVAGGRRCASLINQKRSCIHPKRTGSFVPAPTAVAAIFRQARIALPSRATDVPAKATPPPRVHRK
jgi:hypothetical protein